MSGIIRKDIQTSISERLLAVKRIDVNLQKLCVNIAFTFAGNFMEVDEQLFWSLKNKNPKFLKTVLDYIKASNKKFDMIIKELKRTNDDDRINEIIIKQSSIIEFGQTFELLDKNDEPFIGMNPIYMRQSDYISKEFLLVLLCLCGKISDNNGVLLMEFRVNNFAKAVAIIGVLRDIGVEAKLKELNNGAKVLVKKTPNVNKVLKFIGVNSSE